MSDKIHIWADWNEMDNQGRICLLGKEDLARHADVLRDGLQVTLNVTDDFECDATLVLDEDERHGRSWRAIPDRNSIRYYPLEVPTMIYADLESIDEQGYVLLEKPRIDDQGHVIDRNLRSYFELHRHLSRGLAVGMDIVLYDEGHEVEAKLGYNSRWVGTYYAIVGPDAVRLLRT